MRSSNEESFEDHQTDSEDEDGAFEDGEVEYMRKIDELIQILGSLEELKQ